MAGAGKKAARGREFPISPCLCAASLPVPLGLPRASTVGITAPELLFWAAGALGALCDADAATRGTHSCRDAACTDSSAPLCPSPCAHTMVHPRGAEHPIFLCFCRCSVAAMSPILHRAHPPAHTGPCSLLHHCLPDGVPLQELRCSAGPGKQQHRMAHSAHRETPRPGDGGTDRPGQLSVSIQDRQ